jgi:hypothetical protein
MIDYDTSDSLLQFDNLETSVQLDCSVTENKKPTLKPTQKFKFLPHRSFSPLAFWLSHIAAHLQARTSQHTTKGLQKSCNLQPAILFCFRINCNFGEIIGL